MGLIPRVSSRTYRDVMEGNCKSAETLVKQFLNNKLIELKTQYNLVKKLKLVVKQNEEIVRYVYKFLKTQLFNIIDEQTVQTNSRHKRDIDPFGKNEEKDETTETSPKLDRDIKKDVRKQNYQTLTKIYSLFDV